MTATTLCQRWLNQQSSWKNGRETVDVNRYFVAPVEEPHAKAFVEQHHYSKSFPAARLRYGLFDKQADGNLVGVAVLSVPVQEKVLSGPLPNLEPYVESLELGRFVLLDDVPANGETWFLSRAFKLAHADGIKAVVSFSDPQPRHKTVKGITTTVMPGHVGIIYQASNAIYTGRGTKRTLTVLPDGCTLNDRSKSKVRKLESGHEHVERLLVANGAKVRGSKEDPKIWLETALKNAGCTRVKHKGNHRYLFPLGGKAQVRKMREELATTLAYPKTIDT